jgi:hypothetical protein
MNVSFRSEREEPRPIQESQDVWVIVVILAIVIAVIVIGNAMASSSTCVETRLSPEQAGKVVEQQFNSKLNSISRSGLNRDITPRLKNGAPTLHVRIKGSPSGSTVDMNASVHMEKRGFLPWIAGHGLWVWRRQRRIARALA